MATILLTGATGAVGSSLVPLLVKRGHRLVCLVRGSEPSLRLKNVLGLMDVAVLNGDVTLPRLGVKESEAVLWKGGVDKILHCASSISFNEASAEETRLVNVGGTRNVLDFAERMKIPEVHYVSTAYVAGDVRTLAESDMDKGQRPRNVYERTKLVAEKLVRGWRRGRHSIYRLGIIVGDTVTGWTPAFNGYYVFIKFYWRLKQAAISEPEKYQAIGIGFGSDGMLTLPLFGGFSATSTLNLVPVDWMAMTLARLLEITAAGSVFHVAHHNPPQGRWLNDVSLRHLGIVGIRYGDRPSKSANPLLERIQKMFDRGTEPYLPYIQHEAKFGVYNLPRVLGADYNPTPEIDEPLVARLLDYAISVDFGRKRKICSR